jgi:hypothetical protein
MANHLPDFALLREAAIIAREGARRLRQFHQIPITPPEPTTCQAAGMAITAAGMALLRLHDHPLMRDLTGPDGSFSEVPDLTNLRAAFSRAWLETGPVWHEGRGWSPSPACVSPETAAWLANAAQDALDFADALEEVNKEAAKGRRHRMTREQANLRALELAKQLGKPFFHLSESEQARRIGCSWRTWSRTTFYKEARKRKAQLGGRGGRDGQAGSPPVTGLTDDLEAAAYEAGQTQSGRDEVLNKIIAEQEADNEPSPLEGDPPGARPRKVYTRRRL